MSVLIKGMEMPKNCDECKIKTWDENEADYECPFSGISALSIGRQDDCPLVEVPERLTGRWISQDHNYTHGNISTCMYYYPVCSECGHTGDFNMNYCPNCGADMK